MLILTVGDSESHRWKRKTKKKKVKAGRNKRMTQAIVEVWKLNTFCCAFKLSFLQLICNASLIFKSNFDFALSNILIKKELHESKHVVVECRCLKIWGLLPFLICSSMLVLKWRQASPIWLELLLEQVNLFTRKNFHKK